MIHISNIRKPFNILTQKAIFIFLGFIHTSKKKKNNDGAEVP